MKAVYETSDYNAIDTHIIVSEYTKQLGNIVSIKLNNNDTKVKIVGDKSDTLCFVIDRDVIEDIIADYKYEAIEWYNKKITDCISLDYMMGKKVRFICITDYDIYEETDGTDGYEVIIKTIDDVVKEYINREDNNKKDSEMKKITIADLINFFVNDEYKKVFGDMVAVTDISVVNQEQIERFDSVIEVLSFINDCLSEFEDNNIKGVLNVTIAKGGEVVKLTSSKMFDSLVFKILLPKSSHVNEDDNLAIVLKYLVNIRTKLQNELDRRKNTLVRSKRIIKVLSQIGE